MITYDGDKKLFKLDTPQSTYIIGINEAGYLLHCYYGRYIPDTAVKGAMRRFVNASFSPASADIPGEVFSTDVEPMEYSVNGSGDLRISALAIRNPDGNTVTDIRYSGHRIYAGKPDISPLPQIYLNDESEADTLELITRDAYTGAVVTLYYTVFNKLDAIVRSVKVENAGGNTLDIERVFSLCLDLPTMDYDLITFWGRHVRERQLERRALAHGLQGIHSKRGSSSHCQNPFAALISAGGDEEHGDAYGFNLVYSGNFDFSAEVDFNASVRVIMGINPDDFEWKLEPGGSFQAPEAVCVFSHEGLGEMSRTFHRLYSDNLIRGRYKTEKRPLLINSWEAAYFDFDTDKLVAFGEHAKELGIEMLVMDDGWFGRRNDDTNSLGDWYVNEKKLPGGLGVLVDRIHALGLKFGIWYEPEMISPDSDLFRAHPDWLVHVPGRTPSLGRHQYVIDMSRQDVRDNIFDQMAGVLSNFKIDYLKWDFNRNLSEAGSAILPKDLSKEFFHRFIMGTYELMDRLTKAFPDVLFEGCSGGGGRFDPGILYYMPQIWCSDNTDPIERLTIQFGTSFCYPASAMGAHVSACPRTGYATKGAVALWGTGGFELDPVKLTEDERKEVRKSVADYHKYYDLIRQGDLYRLLSPFDNDFNCAWEFVSPDKNTALLTAVTMRKKIETPFGIKLRGLDPDKYYKCDMDGEIYSGAALMYAGISLPYYMTARDGESVMVELTATVS
ncbi:MAG: alpha-galactosidase [Clostridia bacterium]|nr:alpha-galactosidase [Clostridia bacterium]